MKSDIEIARSVPLERIDKIANKLGINECDIEPYGHYMAKLPISLINENKVKNGNLILVTAITATKSGIGKTTVSVGLAMGLNKIGKNAIVVLREPSLGPCFGVKGGAAGGGYAQVVPMEKINLHFTGDFHAITSAHNMISAMLDNYLYQHESDGFALKTIVWRRVIDVNDRSLREIVIGLGPRSNGVTRQTGFDITPASELMAILCLTTDLNDLERRIGNIILGFTYDDKPFRVSDIGVESSIAALLKDAIHPNLVQTLEHTPALIHGGPFANIAHGCNSIIATKTAMSLGDYVVTEAGFSADLGAEKFYDIKCRMSGLQPKLTVLVATVQGLKIQGGCDYEHVKTENIQALTAGFENIDKHLRNIHSFGQTAIVAINRFPTDTDAEVETIENHCKQLGIGFAVNDAYTDGGEGARNLAQLVVETIESQPSQQLHYAYEAEDSIPQKICKIAKKLYGASNIVFGQSAKRMLKLIEDNKMSKFPVCIAKTQYSFSTDSKMLGAANGFELYVNDLIVNGGAEMIVAIAGDILRMPGLPKNPMALNIKIVNGNIDGLS